MEVSQLFQCNWAHPSTSTTWHTSANQSCHPSCIASLVLLTRSAFTQEVKHSQHCSWVLEAFQPEPRWVCYRLCCSRHVLQMETDSLTGLSLRSEHFRAFFFLALAYCVLRLTSHFLQSNIWKWFENCCSEQTCFAMGTISHSCLPSWCVAGPKKGSMHHIPGSRRLLPHSTGHGRKLRW